MNQPTRVWIDYCGNCGKPDYAYLEKPESASSDCPKCESPRDDKMISGPYLLATGKAQGSSLLELVQTAFAYGDDINKALGTKGLYIPPEQADAIREILAIVS